MNNVDNLPYPPLNGSLGFQLIYWNGITLHPLFDIAGRIFAVLAGQPSDPSYLASVNSAYQQIRPSAPPPTSPRQCTNIDTAFLPQLTSV
ncbi:hypothetical protein MSAN_00629800 [Mycena sanguinolenta]|uniref:Uncharacterized protein n=1 Tax=Mycena sanguinolenta TaxID=230812 RepID=A0A8H6Z0L7_9AGAR|nr:hypothetical protein MSAN_00629800 [Mycena sanguinolenta]